MIQSWYLAADTQIFVASLFVMIMGSKFSKYKAHIYGAAITFGIVLTAIIVYVEKFDGILIPTVQ